MDTPPTAPLIDVRNLNVDFTSANGVTTHAVRDVSFTIAPGESLGLVGESGSGKSVTSLAIMRLLAPQAKVSGQILYHSPGGPQDLLALPAEAMRRMRGTRIAMIFQEPMTALNPVMRVGDQIAEAVLAHAEKPDKRRAWEAAVAALKEVAIPTPESKARDYPHQLSGGMRQRVMIAMALVNRPQLLIADEPTTALDVTIQAQILELLNELRERFGLTMLFISHDLGVVARVAHRVAVMYRGHVVEYGGMRQVFHSAAHPYTQGLLHSVPSLKTDRSQPLRTVDAAVHAAQSASSVPELTLVQPGHWARR